MLNECVDVVEVVAVLKVNGVAFALIFRSSEMSQMAYWWCHRVSVSSYTCSMHVRRGLLQLLALLLPR